MKSVRSGYAGAVISAFILLCAVLVLTGFAGSREYLGDVCAFAVALCYPGSGAQVLLSSSVPESKSTTQPELNEAAAQTAEEPTQPETREQALPTTVQPIGEYTESEDIKAMAEQFAAEYENVTPSGKIIEEFFGSGAAVKVKNAAVRNSTSEQSPDYASLLETGADITIGEKGEVLVLIIHTHTTETYQLVDNGVFYSSYSSRSMLPDRNITRVGAELTEVLTSCGIGVIHDTNVYDEAYNGAYSRSRTAIEAYLEQYPSIQIVLDVHRDAIYYSDSVRCKPTVEIDGRKAAQIMIISGAQEGIVTNFPDWESNLAFALELQNQATSLYDGLMKPIYFCQRKYNMDMTKCSLLIEVGTDANTIGEAVYSAYLLGNALGQLIAGYYGE